MSLEPVLISGAWRAASAPVGRFSAENPRTRGKLEDEYPISSREDMEACLVASRAAVEALRTAPLAPERIAAFLERFAENIELRSDALIALAHLETALPKEPRLKNVELPRTTNQLRQAALAARERSWVSATIDTKNEIRSMFGALGGAVVVFGPNNFPFAFNAISGGDFAAAIAAGNPVIAKAHPLHPGTSKLLAEAAHDAVTNVGLPSGMVQMLYALEADLGHELITDPRVAAIGFTGSRAAGLALKRAADAVGKPIYLELGSVNPVFILPFALSERGERIANDLSGSCLLGVGQFCTNPGLSILSEGEHTEAFLSVMKERFASAPPGTLLGAGVEQGILDGIAELLANGAEVVAGGVKPTAAGYNFQNTLLRVGGATFLERQELLSRETFGPVHLTVVATDVEQMIAIAEHMEGNLTGTIFSHSGTEDDASYALLHSVLRAKVGRLLDDKLPTGVAVSPAMNHGGPYPATGHPGFTSVGFPASIHRFAALQCYDNVRERRLPPELRGENPTGSMWRCIDGSWSQEDVKAP